MFGLFKKKEVSKEDLERKILSIYEGIGTGLKGVENHWKVGNQKQGDELLVSIARACLDVLIGNSAKLSEDGRRVQFNALKIMLGFLERHKKSTVLDDFVVKLESHKREFSAEQQNFLTHFLAVRGEAAKAPSGTSQHRLVYYVCQSCGNFSLMATSPCLYCGFCASTEKEIRRTLLLGSLVLETPFLFHLARHIQYSAESNPDGPNLEEIWTLGKIDSDAKEKTKAYDTELPKLLSMCKANATTYDGPPDFRVRCLKCQHLQEIKLHLGNQDCEACKAPLAIPQLKRLKAALSASLAYIMIGADPQETVSFSNFIATFVLLNDYAIRRDAAPTLEQAFDLIARFTSVQPITFKNGTYKLRVVNEIVEFSVAEGSGLTEDELQAFKNIVSTFNRLFDLLEIEGVRA